VLRGCEVEARRTLVGKLRDVNLEVVIAVGHADRLGSDAYNMKAVGAPRRLGEGVSRQQGIAASRIYTEGKGKRQPVKDCKGSGKTKELIACLEPNRRVETEAVGPQSVSESARLQKALPRQGFFIATPG